jgi:hypothetical protein
MVPWHTERLTTKFPSAGRHFDEAWPVGAGVKVDTSSGNRIGDQLAQVSISFSSVNIPPKYTATHPAGMICRTAYQQPGDPGRGIQ